MRKPPNNQSTNDGGKAKSPKSRGGGGRPGGRNQGRPNNQSGRKNRSGKARTGGGQRERGGFERATRMPERGGAHWIYGQHTVLQALANPRRRLKRLLITLELKTELESQIAPLLAKRQSGETPPPALETVAKQDLDSMLPPGAVHQGIGLLTDPLPPLGLNELLATAQSGGLAGGLGESVLLLALDHVTDPHNVGAIMRSACAFGAQGLLVTERHSPQESGVLAKTASGALDLLPLFVVPNLARALESLKAAGFWSLGLAEEADQPLAEIAPAQKSVLVLGAEGTGLRRLTRETCDQLAKLPTRGALRSLNVSNAAAVALYALDASRQ